MQQPQRTLYTAAKRVWLIRSIHTAINTPILTLSSRNFASASFDFTDRKKPKEY